MDDARDSSGRDGDGRAPLRVTEIVEATAGGTRRHLADLVAGLDPRRVRLHVVCAVRRDPAFADDLARFQARGVRCTQVPMVRPIHPVLDATALVRLLLTLHRDRPQVVHTHSAKAGFLGRLAARLAGVPCVVHTPHHFPFGMDVAAPRRWLYRRLERLAAPWADRIVCVCRAERELALRAGIGSPRQLLVIENGVALPAPPAPEAVAALRAELDLGTGAPVVGVVGRLTPQKGQADLIGAWPLLLRRLPQARLLLVGDGELQNPLRRQVAAAGLQHSVRFTGPRQDVGTCYALFDVLAVPSRWEALPYVLLDGMAAGAAVVAAAVGGVPEALASGEAGVLVPAREPEAFVRALTALLLEPERRRDLGRRARERVAGHYRLDTMLAALETVYRQGVRNDHGKQA